MATTQKIRYSDCDPQGIVFNGNYARYWDDALTDWFAEAGLGGPGMGIGVEMVTARIEMDFRAPASLGDDLITKPTVERIGNTSMMVTMATRRGSDGAVVVDGREVLVFVDPETFQPVTVPDQVRDRMGRAES